MPDSSFIGVRVKWGGGDIKNYGAVTARTSLDGDEIPENWGELGYLIDNGYSNPARFGAFFNYHEHPRHIGSFPTQEAALIAMLQVNEMHFLLAR